MLEGKYPERVLKLAVKRMIKRHNLGRIQMSHLYVYPDETHPHGGQAPLVYDFANKNRKNIKTV